MKRKTIIVFVIILFSFFLVNSCKRSEYTAPNFTGPAVKDLYAMINVSKTVLNIGENTTVTVKVVSNLGGVKNAKVNLVLTTYDGSSVAKYGTIYPSSGTTDENGVFKTILYAPDNMSRSTYGVMVVAYISGDPYLFNNRLLTVKADVLFTNGQY